MVSLVIALVIIVGTWGLFHQSLHLLFDGVPPGINLRDVHSYLRDLPGVESVHDLHIWALGTSEVALTAHLCVPEGYFDRRSSSLERLLRHFPPDDSN